MRRNFRVICLQLDCGQVQPLAWTANKPSVRRLRKLTRKFRHDPDVVKPCAMHWLRLYRTIREMQSELPQC